MIIFAILKVSKVSVIFKSGNPHDVKNYRPTVVLPSFQKVIESVITTRILSFWKTNPNISQQQYRFRKQKWNKMIILNIKDKLIDDSQETFITIGVFLGFKKNFYSIKHEILFQKLEKYEVSWACLFLIKDYLHNRLQYTQICNPRSRFGQIRSGILQESILGPLFFFLHKWHCSLLTCLQARVYNAMQMIETYFFM